MCLYELLLLQGGCAVLLQPHPEEAVVDDIAAIVLVDLYPYITNGLFSCSITFYSYFMFYVTCFM